MLPLKRVLCPTDFSNPSYEGLKVARELSEHFSAELLLVNITFPGPMTTGVAEPNFYVQADLKSLEEAAEKALKDLVQQKGLETLSVRTLVRSGKPADEIVGLADAENADLIVIATHGESGWRKLLFGSVTEKVIRLASCPVLTIRQPRAKE